MTSGSQSPSRKLSRWIAAIGLASALVLLPASWASAHDEIVSTDPAADSTVDSSPTELTLRFSGELVPDDGTAEVVVTDAAGSALQDGPPVIDGAIVTQALSGAAERGTVTVQWRVVSGDGHPVSGQYVFGVGEAPSSPAPPATGDGAGADATSSLVWIALGVVVVGAVVTVVGVLVARRRRGPVGGSDSSAGR